MAAPLQVFLLASFTIFLASHLTLTGSSPINWDKVNLTKKQEETVKRVDCLLNQFLEQIEKAHKKNYGKVPYVVEDESNDKDDCYYPDATNDPAPSTTHNDHPGTHHHPPAPGLESIDVNTEEVPAEEMESTTTMEVLAEDSNQANQPMTNTEVGGAWGDGNGGSGQSGYPAGHHHVDDNPSTIVFPYS